MRLAISLLNLRPGRVGGAETYVRKLVAELPRVAEPGDSLVAIMDREVAAALDTPGWERVMVDRSARRIVAERILEAFTPYRALGVERVFRGVGADVVLFPQQSIFPKRAPGRVVMTAVDVQHLFHPEQVPLLERLYRRAIYPASMARADHLVAISHFTRRTLIGRCGIPPERVTAIPLGYDGRGASDVVPTDRVSGAYLLYPAATFAHKNHAELIRSYAALRRRGDLDAKLVLTGMQTPTWKGLARLARDLGVGKDVVHLGYLPYPELRRVFAGAEAVVFPSRYEGFGIPVVEAALEFGKKVITSRLPVFDEIGVPAERQIDFADPGALLAALRLPGPTVLASPPEPWTECARRTYDVLRAPARPGATGVGHLDSAGGAR
ncbi:MAG TPA: glycosyltransferase family 1 protein [Anaeromyxobacter sp.]